MYSTLIYLYTQKNDVLLPEISESTFNIRWRPVYSKTLKLNKGVDNVFFFQVYNQDQKPVDITDRQLVFRIINRESSHILLTTLANPVAERKGRVIVRIPAEETLHLPSQLAGYSLVAEAGEDWSTVQNEDDLPVFVDDHAGARSVIDIVDSVFPRHIPSRTLTLPTLWPSSGSIYSSEVAKSVDSLITFQLSLEAFTGTVQIEATIGNSNIWYEVGTAAFFNEYTGSAMLHASGAYSSLRLRVSPESGDITKILVR